MNDLTLRGARVIDPYSGSDGMTDVRVRDGVIASESPDAVSTTDVDVSGLVVVPGLLDMHAHVFEGTSHYGVNVDRYCLGRGVTTVVDAGSSGAETFDQLRRDVIETARTRVRVLLNVSRVGMLTPGPGDLATRELLDVDGAVEAIRLHRELVVGVKVRIGQLTTDDPAYALERAKLVSTRAGVPLMVHITGTIMPLRDVLAQLDAGDIVTHCYHGKSGGILGKDGSVAVYVADAVRRGILLDVGHGSGSFSFAVARAALQQGLPPHLVSSDLHAYNSGGPVHDLVTTMSKLVHVGMGLRDVIAATTVRPARVLGDARELGSLAPGTVADLTVLEVRQGSWVLEDAEGELETTSTRLVPRMVIRAGRAIELKRESGASTPSWRRR